MPKREVEDDLDDEQEDEEETDPLDEAEDEEADEEDEDAEESEDDEPAPPARTKGAAKKKAAAPAKGKKKSSKATTSEAIVLLRDGTPRKVEVISISAVRAMVRSPKTGAEVRVQANEVFVYDKDIFAKLEERATKIHSLRDANIILAGKAGLFGGSKRKVRTKVGVDAL